MGALIYFTILVAMGVFAVGIVYRLWKVLRTPVSSRVPITPAPATLPGVLVQLLIETVAFRTLFRASIWTWLFGWLFHVCFLLTLIIHGRFLAIPAPTLSAMLMPYTTFITAGLLFGLLGLLLRRVAVVRVRRVSSLSDYLHLLVFLVLAGSGSVMAANQSVNVYEVTVFVQGLFNGIRQPLSANFILALHVCCACAILLVFPFSKLLHGPLLWLNPTRNQADKSRR